MIERFTKEEFENALATIHPGYSSLGLVQGEECYAIAINDYARLLVRSSIDSSGKAASTGKDSIRLWLEVKMPNNSYKAISEKVDAHTKRVPGWERRLEEKVRILWERLILFRQPVESCPTCGNTPGVNLSKQEKSYGRPFASCRNCDGHFVWLDQSIEKGSKVEFENDDSIQVQMEQKEEEMASSEASHSESAELAMQQKDSELVSKRLDSETTQRHTEKEHLQKLSQESRIVGYEGLNDNQYLAATSPVNQNIRLLAAPGSGKTHTVKYRYQFLVDNGVNPDNILVVTFGKKMADEMAGKIQSQILNANLDQVSTIHAFCFRLLRNWTDNPYSSFKYPDKPWKVKQIIEDLVGVIWQGEEKPNYNEVLDYISTAKYHNEFNKEFFVNQLGSRWGNWLWEIATEYQITMQRNRELDYADMLWYVENLLDSDPKFKAFCQEKFTHLIIDEGQDTNAQALRILFSWQNHSLTVSDNDQMLYRFQGSDPDIMLSDYAPDVETIFLDINYRSTTEIIERCQKLIAHNYSDLGGPYAQQFMKNVSGVKDQGEPITFEMLDTPELESQYIADNINAELQNGYGLGSFFVGARTRAQLAYLEGTLFRANIKFINIASNGSFWETRHVKVLVDYLRLAHNQDNEDALKTVYNVPSNDHPYGWNDKRGRFKRGDYCSSRYLGAAFLSNINYRLSNIDHFLATDREAWRFKTNDKDYWQLGPTKAQDLLEYVRKLTEYLGHCDNAGQALQEIADTSVIKWLKTGEGISEDDAGNGKLDDLQTVIDIANNYAEVNKFLSYVDKMIQASEDSKNGDWDNYAVISTYHKLKGLERPIVFGMGWCEGHNTKNEPVGLLPHTFSLRPPPNFGVLPGGGQAPIEDERCIGFVCVSRAMDKVYLTGTRTYRAWQMLPSRFVQEMGLNRRETCVQCGHKLSKIEPETCTLCEYWNKEKANV